ncbi:MAG: formylglycine-generating enzyme family protein [Luteolibacter sp.]
MFRLSFLLLLCSTLFLRADDVLFVKNSGTLRIHIWANGSYQGWVDPDTTAYMPREGFVTQDSGFQEDGTLKTTHSHGGWEVADMFEIVGISTAFEKDGKKIAYRAVGSQPYRDDDKHWGFSPGSEDDPSPPSDYARETARKMQGGRAPGDLLALQRLGSTEVKEEGQRPRVGVVGPGVSGPLLYAGLKKEEEKKAPSGTFTNSLGMTMIWVKPGAIQRRELVWDQGNRRYVDGGARTVKVTVAYYLGSTEVTQTQWTAVMGTNPSHFKGNSLPVEMVSWNDAMAFCQRLTAREQQAGKLPKGYVYSLPTEDQWEYACRAGTTGDYAGPLDAMAWYDKNSGGRTQPVATKQPNAWGFHDMHGNVWEWYLKPYKSCGGSWFNGADRSSSASRGWEASGDDRSEVGGFRPALVPSR